MKPEDFEEPKKLAEQLKGIAPVKTDDTFNAQANVDEHEKLYTDILIAYTEHLRVSLANKAKYKTCLFWLSFTLLIVFPIQLITVLAQREFVDAYEWWSVVSPAVLSFLTIFIVVPKIIAKYLFNSEEEKYMTDIIKHIQEYDKRQ